MSLPASLTSIGTNPFAGCTNLTGVSVDAGNSGFSADGGMLMNKAGTVLLAWPSAAGNASLPTTVTSVGDYAFHSCAALTSVSLPAVTSIGVDAFDSCTALTAADLPAATSISSFAFASCSGLTAVTIGANCAIAAADSFPNGLKGYYDGNGKYAGVYTWDGATWIWTP
jgi:hypothetical protein